MTLMIYLHHALLDCILSQHGTSLKQQDRKAIRAYRHDILTEFCRTNRLDEPIYDTDEYGKPFVANVRQLHFNQSHSEHDYVLVFGLTVGNVGVDIENLDRVADFDGVAKRFFHADEYQFWQQNQCDKKLWFRLWTIKEAVLKACGLGIRMPLNELNAVFEGDDFGLVCHDKIGRFYFKNLIINDCMVTVACQNASFDIVKI